MSSAPDARQVRAALFLSIGLGVLGMMGIYSGRAELAMPSVSLPRPSPTGDRSQDALAAMIFAEQELLLAMPHTTALGSMNLVASAMLIVGSFMVSSRSRNAIWWVRNATVANAILIVAETVLVSTHLNKNMYKLAPLIREASIASANEQAPTVAATITAMIATTVVVALFRLGLQGLLYWRVGSEPVRAFLATSD